jgi:hypothetical protein
VCKVVELLSGTHVKKNIIMKNNKKNNIDLRIDNRMYSAF